MRYPHVALAADPHDRVGERRADEAWLDAAWADPESGLSFCWLTNGLTPDIVATYKRSVGLSTRAAQCAAREEGNG